MIILGQRTHFEHGRSNRPGETLTSILRDGPRHVVVVPRTLTGGDSVVVAYDGSVQASRTLYDFEASGLAEGRAVHVLSVSHERAEAGIRVNRAVAFLKAHDLEVFGHPVTSRLLPAEVIEKLIFTVDAGLLVMGAFGQPTLREFFLGSVTRTLLQASPVPIFCSH